MACGTGIEGCPLFGPMLPWLYATCLLEPRVVWRSLAIGTDLKGERVFSRQDNYQAGEGGPAVSSAAEFVFERTGGRHTIITDEQMGMGIQTLKKYDGTLCAETDEFASKLTMSLPFAAMMFLMY